MKKFTAFVLGVFALPTVLFAQGEGFSMNVDGAVGATIVDGELVNSIGIRPEFVIGKLGVRLDLSLYLDADGKIKDEYWDEPGDYLEKIYYIRWGQKGDPFYIKGGQIDNVTLGYGLLVNNYANSVEYPNRIRVGTQIGIDKGDWGFDAFQNNFRELDNKGSLYGVRGFYRPIPILEVGATWASDNDQFANVSFREDVKDAKKEQWVGINQDEILDGFLKDDPAISGFVLDAAVPIIRQKSLNLTFYTQYAKLIDYGYGLTPIGAKLQISLLSARAELRRFGKEFVSEYFDRTYELNRSNLVRNGNNGIYSATTKEQSIAGFQKTTNGYFGEASFTIPQIVVATAAFSDMLGNKDENGKSIHDQSLYAEADLNTKYIPQISKATAYYQQTHVDNVFSFDQTQSTIWGYKLGYELAANASLVFDWQHHYVPNGFKTNGETKYKVERVVTIETIISF